jgi:hypothetical protein
MLADLGFFLLFTCTILSAYSAFGSIAAGRLRHRRLFRSVRIASTASAVLCLLAHLTILAVILLRVLLLVVHLLVLALV